jgi:transcription elongation factor GreA
MDSDAMSSDEVLIGATVKLKDARSGEELEYTLVAEEEADYARGKISVTSPVGKGLLNKKAGETAEIQVPAGKIRYKILSITRE